MNIFHLGEEREAYSLCYSGVNIYWLGLDENNPDTPNSGETHPQTFNRDCVIRLDCVVYRVQLDINILCCPHMLGTRQRNKIFFPPF